MEESKEHRLVKCGDGKVRLKRATELKANKKKKLNYFFTTYNTSKKLLNGKSK